MLIVIICAFIVGGMWWRTETKISKVVKRFDIFEYSHGKILNEQGLLDKKIELLAKDLTLEQENRTHMGVMLLKSIKEAKKKTK